MKMEGRWSKRTRPEQWGRKGSEWERWGAGPREGGNGVVSLRSREDA